MLNKHVVWTIFLSLSHSLPLPFPVPWPSPPHMHVMHTYVNGYIMYKTQPGPDPQPRNTPVEWFVCMYKPAQGSDDAIDLLSNLTSNNIVRTTVGGYTVTMVFHNENWELRSQSVIYQPIRSSLQWSHPGVFSTTPQHFPGLTPGVAWTDGCRIRGK